ncbi:MAG: LamG domain-containing protein [Anaerolineae bacterium]|nr:LamG domain-containing protein [Anaerolineae bacterium]
MKVKLVSFTLFVAIALSLTLAQSDTTAAAAPAARSCFPPPKGLTNWWPGDGNTDDIIGWQSAELVNEAGYGAGIVDLAFMLKEDGGMATLSQNFVNVPHDPALNFGTGDFTIDLWVYFNDTEGEQVLVEKWIQGMEINPSYGWTLTKLDNNALRLAMAAGGEEIDIDSGVLDIPTHTWIHLAARRKNGAIILYANGSPVATGTAPLNLDSGSSLKFGHRGNKVDTPGSEDDRGFYLNGRIDEVQLFVGRALPRGLIRAIFEAGNAGQCKD